MRGDFHSTLWSVNRRRRRAGLAGDELLSHEPLQDIGDTHVMPSRVFAFLLDFIFVGALGVLIFITLALAGLFTFGLSWLGLPFVFPLVAFCYNAFTVSGPGRATWGMRAMGLEVVDTEGHPVDFIVAGAHAVLLYVSLMFPPILLFGLFNDHHRLLHDVLTAVVVRRRGTGAAPVEA